MLKKQYEELWTARFQKILDGEEKSLAFYKQLLEENESLISNTKAKDLLKEILCDEVRHVQIARKLIDIVSKKMVLGT